jgi:hypothetical protein
MNPTPVPTPTMILAELLMTQEVKILQAEYAAETAKGDTAFMFGLLVVAVLVLGLIYICVPHWR